MSETAELLLWRLFAPFEFAVSVLVGIVLYLAGALYFAACVFLAALSGLFKRACALAMQRFRVGRAFNSASGTSRAPSLSEIVARRAKNSWLN